MKSVSRKATRAYYRMLVIEFIKLEMRYRAKT